jgi:diguanylate cyclase (GGDEF)-like protein
MSTDLTGLTTLDDAINKISHYWFEYENMAQAYLCLKEDWDNYDNEINEASNRQMILERGFNKNSNISYNKIKYDRKDLMPPEVIEEKAATYVFAAVHYLEHDYGFVCFRFKEELTNMLTLQAWLNNVSSVLENVRMHMELSRLVSRLEDMSIRDELTGLYNRRVLDTLGKKSLEQSIKKPSKLMFFIADMDKLKAINDKFGHTQGDNALMAIAFAFQKAADDDEICIRLGGDEFMAIGMDYDEAKTIRFVNNFIGELNQFNNLQETEFGVYVSYGWNLIYPDKNTTIEECLFTADYRMYQQKYNKVSNNIRANLFS